MTGLWVLLTSLNCTPRAAEEPVPTVEPSPYYQTDLILNQPKPVVGTNATAVLREPSPDGPGLRRFRVVLTWPDGSVDDEEGPMPVIFESHGYRFSLEGWKIQATLEMEPLAPQ